jgi:hypothetical protein
MSIKASKLYGNLLKVKEIISRILTGVRSGPAVLAAEIASAGAMPVVCRQNKTPMNRTLAAHWGINSGIFP